MTKVNGLRIRNTLSKHHLDFILNHNVSVSNSPSYSGKSELAGGPVTTQNRGAGSWGQRQAPQRLCTCQLHTPSELGIKSTPLRGAVSIRRNMPVKRGPCLTVTACWVQALSWGNQLTEEKNGGPENSL